MAQRGRGRTKGFQCGLAAFSGAMLLATVAAAADRPATTAEAMQRGGSCPGPAELAELMARVAQSEFTIDDADTVRETAIHALSTHILPSKRRRRSDPRR